MRRGMTNGWGTVAARAFSAASGAVLVVVLAGCSLGDSAQEAPSDIAPHSTDAHSQPTDPSINRPYDDPPAFHFESGDLVLGDFTYEDIAGNVFNPCEEISAEEFAAIGIEVSGEGKPRRADEVYTCAVKVHRSLSDQTYSLIGGPAGFTYLVGQSTLYERDASTTVPDVYTHGPSASEVDFCYASVDTLRGQFSSAVGSAESSLSTDARCSEAVGILEDLFSL